MTHDEATALVLPTQCWHEVMTDQGWMPGPVLVELYQLAPGASVKTFICRSGGQAGSGVRRYMTSVDNIYLTQGEVDVELVRELQKSVANSETEIERLCDSIAEIMAHPLWQEPD